MKTLTGVTTLFCFACMLVRAFATDAPQAPQKMEVGNASYFRQQGASFTRAIFLSRKITENVNAAPLNDMGPTPPSEGWGVDTGIEDPALQKINTQGDWTETQLLEHAKKGIRKYLASIQRVQNARYVVRVNWTELSYFGAATFFEDILNFTLEKGSDEMWRPSQSVANDLQMKLGKSVFMRIPGAVNGRMRWWDGKKFNDSNPYYQQLGVKSATPKAFIPGPFVVSVDPETGLVALPAKPILEKSIGVLTMELADESIVRYYTGAGNKLPATDQEPLLLVTQHHPANEWSGPWISLSAFGDNINSKEDVIFEKTTDFKSWITIPSVVHEGSTVLTGDDVTEQPGFYRARYRE